MAYKSDYLIVKFNEQYAVLFMRVGDTYLTFHESGHGFDSSIEDWDLNNAIEIIEVNIPVKAPA